MSQWTKIGSIYTCYGNRIKGTVWQDGEFWRNRVVCHGDEIDKGEWTDREQALANCLGSMSRACYARRFENLCPSMPDNDCEEDEDDDDDDED